MVTKLIRKPLRAQEKSGSPQCVRKESRTLKSRSQCSSLCHLSPEGIQRNKDKEKRREKRKERQKRRNKKRERKIHGDGCGGGGGGVWCVACV